MITPSNNSLENCYLCDVPRKLQIHRSSRESHSSFLSCILRDVYCAASFRLLLVTNVPVSPFILANHVWDAATRSTKIKRGTTTSSRRWRSGHYYAKGRRISPDGRFRDVCPNSRGKRTGRNRVRAHTRTHALVHAPPVRSVRFPWRVARKTRVSPASSALSPASSWRTACC